MINHKRTERIYREEGLSLRRRRRKKTASQVRVELSQATRPHQYWSMDFMTDCLHNGRRFRILTLIDEFSRQCLALEVDTSINGVRVSNVLSRVAILHGLPDVIKVDNGPEFISKALDAWAYQREVRLHFSRPGKPVDNAFIESFNSRFREECLNDHWFMSIAHARDTIEAWRTDYNTVRPHSSLNGLTPQEFIEKEQENLQLTVVQSSG